MAESSLPDWSSAHNARAKMKIEIKTGPTKHFGLHRSPNKKRHSRRATAPRVPVILIRPWVCQLDRLPHVYWGHLSRYSQNRLSNSSNSLGLISSLLMPSTSYSTPLRA